MSNFNATIHKFSENFDHPFSHFLYLETFSLRVTVSLICRLQAVSEIHFSICPHLIREEGRNCSTLWPAQQRKSDSQEHVTKYKNMRKWMVRFLIKFDNRGIEISRVNSILITKSFNIVIYFNFVWCWGSVVMLTSLN